MENKEQLLRELQTIIRWEKEQKDLWFWEKLGRLPFVLLDKWTPKLIQDKIELALNEIGRFIQTGGDYLVSEKTIQDKLQREFRQAEPWTEEIKELQGLEKVKGYEEVKGPEKIKGYKEIKEPEKIKGYEEVKVYEEIKGPEKINEYKEGKGPEEIKELKELPLGVMDRVADQLGESRTNMATVQGAATGFGGLFTIVADIPAMLGLSLKVLQELAICYGFNPKDARERTFIIKCLQFSSSDIVGKKAILEELAEYDSEDISVQVMSQLQGWREVVSAYRDSFGMKKLFQLVPIAGTLFGAYSNRESLQQVAETGKMLYRKRRIMERLRQLEEASV
ncbi:EcsC family protein [Paenibacillus radicis (ex Xue et al. 2023)]|uniref:EcsC family protein n=1 Tax=Paenibacillus radicis (ex Xue et al. 2023) TaxID=2972489 RepID=A0ABT1YLG6_9BACL|nr:EcsC family protein [Paenibacillus radicis (ex Xue et al. 2023)]MCR8634026.1 EcsC family protein [Paenibacillus radicis (ex Xue et al. 2023)]